MVGQTVAEAKEALKKSKLEAGEEKSEASDTVAKGALFEIDPEAGAAKEANLAVNLVVSSRNPSNWVIRPEAYDVVVELKEKKVPENLIKMEE